MWEERFAQEGYLFGTEPVPFLLKHDKHFAKGQSVLSIAEGEGRNGVHLAKKGLSVTGVEFAPSAVAKANKLATLNKVDVAFVQSDLFEWSWPYNAFDITLGLFFQFVGPVDRDILWQKMLDATSPGGLIAIHGYTPKQLDLEQVVRHIWKTCTQKKVLKQSFMIAICWSVRNMRPSRSLGLHMSGCPR